MIELRFQSGGLNINMLCSKLEKSPLFMLFGSHIKSFRRKNYGDVRLHSSDHNESQERQGDYTIFQ